MERFEEILMYELFGNTVYDYGVALIVFVGLLVVFKLFKILILRKLTKLAESTENDLDDVLVRSIKEISFLFYFVIAMYFPLRMLLINGLAWDIISGVFLVVVVYQGIKFLQTVIEYFLLRVAVKKDNDGLQAKATFVGIRLMVRIVLWVTAILLILSNLGVNITSLIASLGIGGLAVAFAVQNLLVDLFSSFSIYFDKPFQVGDTIKIGDQTGKVKYIGLKTTRIITLEGDELVVSNSELTSSQVRNFGKMKHRRVKTSIGVEYGTPMTKLKKINDMVKKIVDKVEDTEFDRCHFKEFGDFSLNYEIIYMIMTGDMAAYMDRQQEINFALAEAFEKESIGMAFPTQTVYVKKD
jgi:small-conductance mechanosensitive channel